jgi:hypothetical protein
MPGASVTPSASLAGKPRPWRALLQLPARPEQGGG